MTPSEEIKNMLIPILSSMRAHGSTEAEIIAYRNGFTTGAMWRQTHPHWISVEDELPKIGWTMSDTVVVTDGQGGLRLAWYHQDEGWHFATGLTFEPTHWMPLPSLPVLSNSSNTGKKSNFDENCEKYRNVFDGWEDLTFEERRDRINKFRSGQW